MTLRDELQRLVDAAASPNGWDWMFPLRVVPVDGKPTIVSHKGGNLFRGYIGTWKEADLLVALANAAPRILAALTPKPEGETVTDDGEAEAYRSDRLWWLEIAEGKGYDSITAALEAAPSASPKPTTVEASWMVERLMHVIDRDRYVVAHCVGAIEQQIRSREWLTEGRGPYEWDDDRYREEFAEAIQAIRDEVKPLAIVAWDKNDCTRIEERVNAARSAAREMLSKPIGPRDMIAADIFRDPRDIEIEKLRAEVATLSASSPSSEQGERR